MYCNVVPNKPCTNPSQVGKFSNQVTYTQAKSVDQTSQVGKPQRKQIQATSRLGSVHALVLTGDLVATAVSFTWFIISYMMDVKDFIFSWFTYYSALHDT